MKNREMKFRAWDRLNRQFEYFALNKPESMPISDSSIYSMPKSEYIGLNDKNGKDIYEGDILQLINADGNKVIVVCEWGIHKRKMLPSKKEVEIPGFAFVFKSLKGFPSFPITKNYAGKSDLDIIQVIGNIYENPELIKNA